jgi:hypothetical protein
MTLGVRDTHKVDAKCHTAHIDVREQVRAGGIATAWRTTVMNLLRIEHI